MLYVSRSRNLFGDFKNLTSICGFKPVTKEIILNPKLEINPIPTSYICEETEMTFNANANIENVDFSWCTIDGKVISNDKTIKITVSKDTSFILKAKDIYGCVASDTFDIKMFTFNYSLDIPETSCRNLESVVSIDIANPELYTFQWLPLIVLPMAAAASLLPLSPLRIKYIK